MSYNSHHWGAPTASGQSTGEGGNAGGRYGSSLEMEPMIGTASSGSGGSQGQSKGSSKYHGKRTSPGSAGRMVLVTLACLAMLYFGYGVGRDDGLETAKQPNASPTPSLVRKPPTDQKNEKVMTDRPNADDEPSDEDDKDADVDAPQEKANDGPSATGGRSKPVEEDPADAVAEDEAARQDNEDEDDDATQDFAPDGDNDDDAAEDDDDDSTEDFDDEDKDGHVDPTPEEKVAQQNEDDDSVVDDDAVSQDADDDDVREDDANAEDDANVIAKKLVPGGVSDTPTTAYSVPDAVHNRFVKWSKELHQISEMEEYKGGEPRVNWEWHPRKRADRFPAVDDRVRAHLH